MAYETIKLELLTPHCGAVINGVDLSQELSKQQFSEIHDALMQHGVIFFRDQQLSVEQHKNFGRRFGELHVHPNAELLPNEPEILVIKADENSTRVAGEGWHTDVSCDAEPPMGSILYIHQQPPVGGDTLFANMCAAYDALSEPIKRMLDGLTAVHDSAKAHGHRVGATDRSDLTFPRNEHPIVRTHPVTRRKILYVNPGFTTHIPSLKPRESSALLDMLFEHAALPQFQCRWKWSDRSIAFWDNRSTHHQAMWDYFPQKRYGHRVTICGDKPF